MKLSLEEIAKQLSPSLKIKPKVRALIYTALYQLTMMDKLPTYAVVNETVSLAKKTFSKETANFLNALLRKLETKKISFKDDEDSHSLSIRFSYPKFFIDLLRLQFGLRKTLQILELGNKVPVLMARDRKKHETLKVESSELKEIVNSSQFYIQNSTPAQLFDFLYRSSQLKPLTILDLCSAPGGKLLLANEYFPDAILYANDVSENKIAQLKQNLSKYHVKATLSCSHGENFHSDQKFDLIIIDAPCSNSGVLNKRPEARWRFNEEALQNLIDQSKKLITHAKNFLKANGRIWFMTCSILQDENEHLLKSLPDWKIFKYKLILPGINGEDGGFAAEIGL